MDPSGEELVLRPYAPGDEQAILETFNRVFREVCGEGFRERSLAEWNWQFRENPRGMRVMLAVDRDGTVAAQYAAVPMAALSPLGPTNFLHAVDSMVHPEHRAGLKKPGLFVRVGQAWFEWIRALGLDSVGFGYPVRPAWRIGSRYLGYTLVRVIDYLACAAERLAGVAAGAARIEVQAASAFPAGETDALWEEWALGVQAAIVRDAAYLDWRYRACPGRDYRILLARRQGRLVGLAVVHPSHELLPGSATLAEWLVLPGEDGAGRALLSEAGLLARRRERSRLLALVPPWRPEWGFLQGAGFEVVPSADYLERRLGSYLWKERMTSAWLAEHWFYTLGDSDLV